LQLAPATHAESRYLRFGASSGKTEALSRLIGPEMPRQALKGDSPDYRVRIDEMAPLLVQLSTMPAGSRPVPW
jgi:hypothetical protein